LKKIGITGGIGSGKSIVGQILEAMHFPVYYSDQQSKILVDSDPEIREELIKLLGAGVYLDGKLNRPFLTLQLFSNDELRLKINQIIHPKVRDAFNHWVEKQTSSFVFNEAAILFETGAYQMMDCTILVTAPINLRITRVMKRDHITMNEVQERISKQWSDEEKIPLADYILLNDEVTPLLKQVEEILKDVKNKK
jgi:dephospho-CoA kinase